MTDISRRFRFQRFAVADDRCGMKIGTDGVLLGAWADAGGCQRILDIGTGCGIVALMLAQRTESNDAAIVGIECDANAASQASENFAASPWADRVSAVQMTLQRYVELTDSQQFDLCVCNPPYFLNSTQSPHVAKNLARHDDSLSLLEIAESASCLLKPSGRLCLVLPYEQLARAKDIMSEHGFALAGQLNVRGLPGTAVKRVLLKFDQVSGLTDDVTELTIESSRHIFSPEYEKLTRRFHLRFAEPEPPE